MDNKYLSISAITRYLKAKFDLDDNLKSVFLKGEISNFKAHTSGHLYFSLKDEGSKINAIMFSRNAAKINFKPVDGTKVLVSGRISVYEPTGNYQIYVDDMEEDGVGNLYVAYEKLKQDLEKEGLFKQEHKKIIPRFPKKVGVITASTGAAVRDIITTIERRFPICEIILFPTLVQGENAKEDIVKNIKRAEDYDLDVLIVGRGGGSIEDLWAFNEEIVARAIYNCTIPTISAVGHEIDFTISDFVSDLRAPTPTAAAEMAVPNIIDLEKHIGQLNIRLKESIIKKVKYQKLYLDSIKNSFVIKNPMIMYENKKQTIDLMQNKIKDLVLRKIEKTEEKLNNIKNSYVFTKPEILYQNEKQTIKIIIEKLELLNPLNTLNRGYSITYSDGKVIKDIKDVKDTVTIKLYNGSFKAKVIEIGDEKNG
ncbi:MAG: exodeoxyribonuclease VII large subunit [Bacilli bacterium]|nr:exodeoxyribonuclease VII large subunit [Bacilli bacterium]